MKLEIKTIVHSLRNPLNTIRGAVTFIREEYSSDSNLINFTDIIEDEIKRLETLITQVLNSSFHIVKRYADINSLLKDIEVTTTLQTLLRNIEASFEYNEIPLVNIDAFQIEQAIRNIINNAIDAMPDGGQLIVRTGIESDNVFIEVSDTGVGIHRQIISCIGSPGNKRRGFGLYIARQILSIHGGRLMIISREAGGTTVKMLIPIEEGRQNGGEKKSTDC